MRKFRIMLMYLVFFVSWVIAVQKISLFSGFYGSAGDDQGIQAISTNEGGYLVLSQADYLGFSNCALELRKIDVNVQLIWNVTYTAYLCSSGSNVIQTTDSGFVVAGASVNTAFPYYQTFLIKYDIFGNFLWNRLYTDSNSTKPAKIMQTYDGGLVILGQTKNTVSNNSIYFMETDPTGYIQLSLNMSFGINDYGIWITQLTDGYVIAAQTQNKGAGDYDFLLYKMDITGVVKWGSNYGGSGSDNLGYATTTSDGGYALAGYTNSFGIPYCDIYVVKTDCNGLLVVNKTYGGSKEDYAFSITSTSDGGFAIFGKTSSFGNLYFDMYLVKADINLNMEWDQFFNVSGSTSGISIAQANPSEYGLVGKTSINPSTPSQLLFIKYYLCPTGTYEANDTCFSCPSGTYNSITNITAITDCLPCDKGFYSLASSTYCLPCADGSYADTTGSSQCTLCPAGTYGNMISGTRGSLSYCAHCPANTYNPNKGNATITACQLCPTGYMPSYAQDFCTHVICHSFCLTCYGTSNSQCNQCNFSVQHVVWTQQICRCNLGYVEVKINGTSICQSIS